MCSVFTYVCGYIWKESIVDVATLVSAVERKDWLTYLYVEAADTLLWLLKAVLLITNRCELS